MAVRSGQPGTIGSTWVIGAARAHGRHERVDRLRCVTSMNVAGPTMSSSTAMTSSVDVASTRTVLPESRP